MITIQKPSFAYDALEPHIDARTMEIHTEKHHQTYADKLNALIDADPTLQNKTLEEILTLNPKPQTPVLNMAGGVSNHNFFWSILTTPSESQGAPAWFTPELKTQFTEASTKLFGSGWVWLVLSEVEGLQVISTPNQDSPITQSLTPILGIDLWEHAYYLNYQNRRPEYIEGFWHVVNWDKVNQLYSTNSQK